MSKQVNYQDGDILTTSANGSSILVTYNENSVSAGELTVIPQLYQITSGAGSTYNIGSTNPILIICSGVLSDLTGRHLCGWCSIEPKYALKYNDRI